MQKTSIAEISQHTKLLTRASRYLVMYITLSIPSHLIIQEDIFISFIISNCLSIETCMLCVICQTNLPQQQFSNSIILFTTIFELTQDNKILITATKLFPYHSLYSSLLPWNFCRLFGARWQQFVYVNNFQWYLMILVKYKIDYQFHEYLAHTKIAYNT